MKVCYNLLLFLIHILIKSNIQFAAVEGRSIKQKTKKYNINNHIKMSFDDKNPNLMERETHFCCYFVFIKNLRRV